MEEAIKNLYSYAQSEGYQKSIEEFAELLQTNDEALDAMYSYVQSQGYTKELDDFKTLIGKKKIEEEPTDSGLPDGSSELLEEDWQETSKDLEATARQLKATEGLIRERGWSQDLGIQKDSLQQEFERLNKIVHDIPAREPISSDATPPITEVSSDATPPTIKDELDENITADFLRRKESFIVPQLNYLYGDQGFKFEEANILGQKIKVTARNGEKLGVNIGWGIINEQKKAEELKEFIRENREESSSLARRTIGYEANAVKFKNEQQAQDSLSAISKREDFINKGLQRFLRDKENIKKALLDIDTMLPDQVAELNQKIDENNLAGQNLQQYLDSHLARESEMNIEIGKYYEMKEQQGSFGSLMMHGGARGVTGPVSEIVGYAIDMGVRGSLTFNPLTKPFIKTASRKAIEKVWGEEKYKEEMIRAAIKFKFPSIPSEEEIAEMTVDELEEYFDRDADKKTSQILIELKFPILGKLPKPNELQIITNEILDRASKDIKYGKEVDGKREGGAVTAIREDVLEWAAGKSISEQYEMAQREDFWVGAFYGLAQSIPSLVTGPARLPSLFMLTSGALDEEMSRNPMFNEFSEDEKAMFKMPVALIAAILENYGFRNVMQKKGLIVNILTKVMGKMPKGGGAQTFKEFVELEVKNRLAKGALVVGGAGLAELETGALQELTEIEGKRIMNMIKDQDLFTVPDFVSKKWFSQIGRAARQEMVGGITLGTIPGVAIAVRDNRFNNLTEQQIAIFREIKNDPTISQKALKDKLKMQINQGELTAEQAKQIEADYNLAIGLANELPGGINNPDFAEAMDLKIRKRILEERKNNKDPSLGAVQQIENEIDGINKRLQEIKEAPESAADFPGATTQESQDITEVTEAAEQSETTEEETESAVEVFFGETPSENTQQVSGNLVINEEGAPSSLTKSKELLRNTIKALAKTGAKAIEKLFPDVKIILHENTSQFERFAPANNSGYYNSSENVIHVDLNKAGVTTVPHEIFHATLLNKIKGGDIEAAKMAEAMMTAVRKVLRKNSKLAKQIDEYAARYKDKPELQNEERLAELIGIMSSPDNYRTLTPPQKNIVKKFIEDLAKYLGLENYLSEFTKEDADIIDLLNTLSRKIRTGEAITETDVEALNLNQEEPGPTGPAVNIQKPSTPKNRQQRVKFKESYPLSLISPKNEFNINNLIDDIVSKNQTVNFWVADQLGIGDVGGQPIDGGPSFAFNQQGDVVWASNKSVKALNQQLQGDYIFIISGSPTKSKLYNKSVFDILVSKLGDYNTFREKIYLSSPNQKIKEPLRAHDSWESMREDPHPIKGRKAFFNEVYNYLLKTNTDIHKYIQSIGGYDITPNDLRDGFYKENDFKINDIMLVLKKTGAQEGAQHSTYTNEVLGEVIGVPDRIINAADIIDVDPKRVEGKPRSVTSQVVAPYGLGKQKLKPKPKTQDRSQRKPQPKTQDRSQRVKTIQEVAESFNINIHSGFFNPMVDEYHLKKAVEPLRSQGFTVDRATRGSMSLHLRKYGKFYNPFDTPSDRSQRTDSFYEGIVDDLRKRKVREELIIDLLRRKYKLPVKQAKEFLGAKTLLGAIPESFKNLKGGVNAGVNLLLKVEKEVINLRAANQKRKDPLSPTEITDKVINKFMTFPEYTSQAETVKVKGKVTPKKQMSTTQAKMISDVSSLLESRGSQSMSLEITRARNIIKERKKGALSIKQTQQELINFLRRNLPKTIFTRAETLKLIRTIQQASSPELKGKNIENLMDEIEDLMTVQKGDYLLKRINQIFKGKYEVRIGGRLKGVKIDNETRKRLKRISEYLAGPKATAEMIKKLSAKLTEEIESITTTEVDIETGELTPEALMKVVDLTTALNYNEALLGDPKDVSRVENLTTALIQLENIIVRGRDALQAILQEKTKGYSQDLAILIKELTGKELNPEDKNFKQEVEDVSSTREGIAKAQKVSKNVITYFTRLMREFNSAIGFSAAQDLTAIIHQLVEFPGVVFGGQLQEIIGDQVNEATRNYKARIMMFNVLHRGALEEFYGKKWAKVHRELNQTDNIFLKNKQEVEAAQQNYDNNKTTENKRKLRDVRARNAITLSQEQMGYLLNQYKDPALNSTFKRMYGEEYERVMQEMDEKLDDRVRQYAEWQVNEFYPAMKVRFNETYKKLYYTDMPSNKYYAGPLLRKGDKVKDFDLLKGASMWIPTIGALYTKFRVQTTTPIIPKGLSESMSMYMQDMEYFDAYAVIVNRMSKLFTNPHSQTIIKSIHGEQFYNLLSHQINMIATGAKTKANLQGAKYWNFFNNWFQISRLMLAPAIAIKQLTSIPTFAIEPDMGKSVAQRIGNWFKYAAKNKAQQLKVWKEVLDNSVYLQDRADKSITRSIEMYSPERYASFLPGKTTGTFIVDFLMSFIKVTDRAAIMLGGLPNYSYHKAQFIKNNPNATEQQAIDYAIRKFEKATKSTQQSYDLQDRDIFQTVNPFARGFNMFLTTPKQYLRKEIMATRDMKRALKRKWAGEYNEFAPGFAESFFQFAFYHAYMPVLFQYVTLGLPGLARDWRDDDDETLLTAAVFGNLNAIFLLGQIAEQWKEAYRGKPWFRKVTSMPIFDMAADIAVIIDKFFSAETNEETEKAYKEMFEMVNKNGLPFSLLKRWVENVQKVINGETENYGEDLLRLFNFTDYAIEGMKKKGKKTKMYSPKKRRGSGGTLDLDLDLDIDLNTDVELDELNELYF